MRAAASSLRAGGFTLAGRRGDLVYFGWIALVIGAAWLGLQLFGNDSGRPFDESQLTVLMQEIELPPIDFAELSFGFLKPSKRHAPLEAQVHYADEMELLLVQNRNQLLRTATPSSLAER
jgi:hypothetical protein